MTDTEIKKALEDLLELMLHEGDMQRTSIISKALDLINRQQAEIERLKSPKFFIKSELSEKELSEVLKKGRVGVIPHIKCSINRIDEDGIRAEAIKEVVESLKKKLNTRRNKYTRTDEKAIIGYCLLDIDNLVKEMVGE